MPSCSTVRRVGIYKLYVLLLCLVAYLLNQLDRYLLPILSRPLAQTLEYGDKSCLKSANYAQANSNVTCENIKDSPSCNLTVGNACEWTFNGQGFEYQLIVGPVFIVIYTFCGIFIGYSARYFRRKSLLSFFLIFWSVATILNGLVKNYWQLALLRFALGIGEAGCTPFATSILVDMFEPGMRATALSVYNFGIYVGYSMSYALGNFLLQANILDMGWRWAYFLSGAPGVLIGVLIFFTVKEPSPQSSDMKKNDETTPILTNNSSSQSLEKRSKTDELKGVALTFLSPSLLMLCLAGSIRNSAGYVWGANTQPFFLLNGQTPQQIGSFMSWIPLVGGSLGVLFGGFISDRVVKRRGLTARVLVLAISQIAAAPFALMALFLPAPWCYVSLIPSNIFGEMWVGVCLTVVTELVDGRMRTMAVAYYLFIITNIGGNLPLLVPVFQTLFSSTLNLTPVLALRYSLVVLFPGLYALSSLLFGITILVMKWQTKRDAYRGYSAITASTNTGRD